MRYIKFIHKCCNSCCYCCSRCCFVQCFGWWEQVDASVVAVVNVVNNNKYYNRHYLGRSPICDCEHA